MLEDNSKRRPFAYWKNLQLLDIQVKIQEEIGHKDGTSPNDTDDN